MTIQNVKRLAVIDGETLMDARLPKRMNRTDYLIACAMGKRITVINDLTALTR